MSIQMGTQSYSDTPIDIHYWHSLPPEKSIVQIGNYCSIGADCQIFIDGNHKTNFATTFPFKEKLHHKFSPGTITGRGAPTIGHDVWIARNVTIIGNVKIGTGAVIGYGSVITKDVPPYGIVAGNPATLKKYRFDEKTVAQLLETKWWDLPFEKVMLCLAPVSDDIEEWIKRANILKQTHI